MDRSRAHLRVCQAALRDDQLVFDATGAPDLGVQAMFGANAIEMATRVEPAD
jgi:hypothetical protein